MKVGVNVYWRQLFFVNVIKKGKAPYRGYTECLVKYYNKGMNVESGVRLEHSDEYE